MKIEGIHTDVHLEATDYFLARPDGPNLKLILTCGNRKPLNLHGITRQQAYRLISQLQKAILRQDETRVQEEPTPEAESNTLLHEDAVTYFI